MSPKFSISDSEIGKVLHNAAVFLAPLALIYFGFVISNVQKFGFNFDDFVPDNAIIGAGSLYVLNVLVDFFRKFVPSTQPPQV